MNPSNSKRRNEFQRRFEATRRLIIGLPRPVKTLIQVGADLLGFMVSALVALWLVFGTEMASQDVMFIVGVVTAVSLFIAYIAGFYQSIIRYIGVELLVVSALTVSIAAVIGAGLSWYLELGLAPMRWGLAFAALALIYGTVSRIAASRLLRLTGRETDIERALIYGAGEAGAQLLSHLANNPRIKVVGLIDDNKHLQGTRLRGCPVFGPDKISELVVRRGVQTVLFAIPSASRARRRQLIEELSDLKLELRSIPNFEDLVSGRAQVDDLHKVEVGDLLGRTAVLPIKKLLAGSITGKSVMVTGAGGSIGAELCRQALSLEPTNLVLYEISEPALHAIEQQLLEQVVKQDSRCRIIAVLGSVVDRVRVIETMQAFVVNTVYHAAAYKHVPMVERNLLEGVKNNVLGTWNTASAAIQSKVSTFVLISTDKAVNPTNIMGASKRLAELCLQGLQDEAASTKFAIVRFGNVLDSSGSVIPIFREQIRSGGPVTVTHPEIVRYFMTIPEAAQLVIQAASMEGTGEVFVLDMGESVKIDQLARDMIKLSGLTIKDKKNPEGDIEIIYTGLRPAEKLYEELLIGQNVIATEHPRILRAKEHKLENKRLHEILSELELLVTSRNCERMKALIAEAVAEYTPYDSIEDVIWNSRLDMVGTTGDA